VKLGLERLKSFIQRNNINGKRLIKSEEVEEIFG